MATAREIHRHMKGIKNIGQITKAMKMVAAARLRKAQEKAGSSRPYALKIKEVLANIVCDKTPKSILCCKNAKSKKLAIWLYVLIKVLPVLIAVML